MIIEIQKIKRLFAFLDDSAVRYCHWKSNQHLAEALAGKTDLDILVDGAQADFCRQLLRDCGCKQVVPQPRSLYPGIEDWLAFDEETGRLAHIHLHFKIIAGAQPKNYHLPLENWLLSGCGSLYDLKIAAHEKELIVLILRMAFKTRYRDLLKAWLRPAYDFLPQTIRAELNWLLERAHTNTIIDHVRTSGMPVDGALLIDFCERYTTGRITPAYFLGLKIKLAGCLKQYRLRSFLSNQVRCLAFFIQSLLSRSPGRKTLNDRGVFFALVGADGSGKTRLARDLLAWLNWKVETRIIYFGIPKSARAYAWLKKTMDVIHRLKKKARPLHFNLPGNFLGAVSETVNSLLWVYIGRRRFALSRQAKNFQTKGFVIIAERFPLKNFMGMAEPMDGPRLQKQAQRNFLCGLEHYYYRRIEMPDRLFVLRVGLAVLRERKKNTQITNLSEKADAVNCISADDRTIIVDAEAPYESVLLTIKRNIWDML